MATAEARERYARKNEADELRRAFELLDSKHDGRLDAQELSQLFSKLGHPVKKSDIEEMLWEVDEDCDQAVTWAEFQAMYHRCRTDQTGEEPRRLFNVVQFVINDKYQQGHVALEEAMQLMYLRYGRAELDQHLEEIFGTSDINSGKSLTLSEFLQSLHVSQVKQLLSRDPAFLAKTYKPNVSIKKR